MSLEKHKPRKTMSLRKTTTKGFALTHQDLDNIKMTKKTLLEEKIFLTDSGVVRMALDLAVHSHKEELKRASARIEKISLGRPKGS